MWAEIRGYWTQLNLDYFTIPSLRPVSCFMATHQLDVGTSTSSDWSRFTYSRLKLNLLPPVIWSNNWSNHGAVIQSHNSATWSWSVNFSAFLPYIPLSLVRKNNEEECDRRSGGRVNVWWANPRTSKCVTSLLDEWKCDMTLKYIPEVEFEGTPVSNLTTLFCQSSSRNHSC